MTTPSEITILSYRMTPQRRVYWDAIRAYVSTRSISIGDVKDAEVMDWMLARVYHDIKNEPQKKN